MWDNQRIDQLRCYQSEYAACNPLRQRVRYHSESDTRHCRDVAPTPEELLRILEFLEGKNKTVTADCIHFLALTGLRIREALSLKWDAVNWGTATISVKREKHGINPWVKITGELNELLQEMRMRNTSDFLFPSPLIMGKTIAYITVAGTLRDVAASLAIRHVSPHGLRSFFVTQCREAGLSDTDVAALIGDKTGAEIIRRIYGDRRESSLRRQVDTVSFLKNGSHSPDTRSDTRLAQPASQCQVISKDIPTEEKAAAEVVAVAA